MILFMDAASNKGWLPPKNVSQSEFDRLKHSSRDSALKGFVGCALSFGSQFLSGYVGKYDKKKSVPEYIESSKRRILKSSPMLKGVHYKVGGYDSFRMPKGMIIVCDPPYAASKEAKPNPLFREFDNNRFWEWVRKASKDNLVFVCEEKAPSDFICVWQKDYTRVTNQKKHTQKYTKNGEKAPAVKTVEKLFIYKYPPPAHAFDRPIMPW
jgi:DNA adenine methylase